MIINQLKKWLLSRSRRPGVNVTTIVLHGTDGASASSSIEWLRQIKYSYHYIIGPTGAITKCVPVGRVAFHAGKSFGPNGDNVNEYSIGIAFDVFESRGELVTDDQVDAAIELIRELRRADTNVQHITTHYAISPGRKTDPATLTREQARTIRGACAPLGLWRVRV